MSSLFGLSNGYEQVGETPAPFQPPGTKKSNPLDLAAMKEGIASAAQGLAKQVGVEGIKKQDKLPEHLRPPSTTWDQKPGKGTPGASASAFQSGFQNTSPAGLGPGGVVGPRNPHANPYDDPSNAPSGKEKMNLGNKYAKSYSSANPPPRVTDLDDSDDESEKKPSFMDELGMDKEPTRKEKKKKLQKIAENPGILVEAAARGDAAEVRELIVDYDVPADACAPPKKTAYGDDGGSFEPTPLVVPRCRQYPSPYSAYSSSPAAMSRNVCTVADRADASFTNLTFRFPPPPSSPPPTSSFMYLARYPRCLAASTWTLKCIAIA